MGAFGATAQGIPTLIVGRCGNARWQARHTGAAATATDPQRRHGFR
jgi:hypothetical protein